MVNIPYSRQWIDQDDIKEVVKVLKSDWITQGPKIAEFERSLAGYCGAKYAVAVSSGTAALHLACLAAGLKKSDEVITTPITFAATSNAVLYAGATPVFADVCSDTANIDPSQIKRRITGKTKALLPVHYAGLPCDMKKISAIARKHKLLVIEDGCHALGAAYKDGSRWVKVGSCRHSDMAVFSFHPVKSIATGEGGAVLTNRKDLYAKLLQLRTHGITKDRRLFSNEESRYSGEWYYEMQSLGFNYRITDIQCALGISQLKKLNLFISKRREIADFYRKAFQDNPYFQVPSEEAGKRSAWHLYSVRLKEKYVPYRAELFAELRRQGIGVQVHYIPVYWQPYYRMCGYTRGLCPAAENFYSRTMSLPLYPSLKERAAVHVVSALLKVFSKVAI